MEGADFPIPTFGTIAQLGVLEKRDVPVRQGASSYL
jgi:hypothetical protein